MTSEPSLWRPGFGKKKWEIFSLSNVVFSKLQICSCHLPHSKPLNDSCWGKVQTLVSSRLIWTYLSSFIHYCFFWHIRSLTPLAYSFLSKPSHHYVLRCILLFCLEYSFPFVSQNSIHLSVSVSDHLFFSPLHAKQIACTFGLWYYLEYMCNSTCHTLLEPCACLSPFLTLSLLKEWFLLYSSLVPTSSLRT